MNEEKYTNTQLIDAWIRYTKSGEKAREKDELFWAYEAVAQLADDLPFECLVLIINILARDSEMPVIGALAAGPMEDLLVNHGPAIIDQVTKEAHKNETFRTMLGGVWKNGINSFVWEQIDALRENAW